MTQERLARAVNLSRVSISNIEKGRQNFLVHTLWEIARTLGTHPSELLPQRTAIPTQPTDAKSLDAFRRLPAKDKQFVSAVLSGASLTHDTEIHVNRSNKK